MSGIVVAITPGTTGTMVAMTGTIGEEIEILIATGVTYDQTAGIGSGKEIN
jgi:hypothetical protein